MCLHPHGIKYGFLCLGRILINGLGNISGNNSAPLLLRTYANVYLKSGQEQNIFTLESPFSVSSLEPILT